MTSAQQIEDLLRRAYAHLMADEVLPVHLELELVDAGIDPDTLEI